MQKHPNLKRIIKRNFAKLKGTTVKEVEKMKWKTLIVSASLSSLLLTACGVDNNNNNNANDTAMRNKNDNTLKNVNYNPNTTNRNYDNNNVNRDVTNITNRNPNANNNDYRMRVADKAAERIVGMREVDQANVIVTDNNAYVAAKLANNAGNQLEKNVEKKISNVVKSTDRNIDHVYVSVNPDFYTRTTSYANDIRNGRPVAGFFDEFNTLVHRIFPTAR